MNPADILVIEDDALDRELLVELLTLRGRGRARISEAATWKAAEERLAERPYALVLLDTRLPDASALHAIRTVGEKSPDTPVLPHTAFITSQMRQAARDRGAFDVVVRGELNPLWSAVNRLLALRDSAQEPQTMARAVNQ